MQVIENMEKYKDITILKKELKCTKCLECEEFKTDKESDLICEKHYKCDANIDCIRTWICKCGSKGRGRNLSEHIKTLKHRKTLVLESI